ncbi:DUF5134 domain-containing protein [Arthrobacter sp. RHLT1-20]
MIADEALRWAMAALLLGAASYAAFRAGRNRAPAVRVDYGLHALMMTAMILMLFPGVSGPALPQILVFVLAAWWFVIRAAALPPHGSEGVAGADPGHSGRGRHLYNALAMAATAYMLAAMDLSRAHGAEAGGAGAGGVPGQTAHHIGAAGWLPLPGSGQDWSSRPALILAVVFGAAGAAWAVHLLRGLRPHALRGRGRGDTILELVGAASMAVMFAALAG